MHHACENAHIKEGEGTKDMGSGGEIPEHEVMVFEEFERRVEYAADVITRPGEFNMYRREE